MPRSHICTSCLTELARVRAVPDPHYGLPIVVCPGCRLASVRTRHPDQQFWRVFRKRVRAIRTLLLPLMVTVISSGAILGMMFWAMDLLGTRHDQLALDRVLEPTNVDGRLGLGAIFLVALGAGGSMRFVYGHRRAFAPMLIMSILSGILMYIDVLVMLMMRLMAWAGDFQAQMRFPSTNELVMRAELYGIFMFVAAIGLIPGTMLCKVVAAGNERRFCKIRKKRLKKMQRHD